mgnify:CR=1 FL=1
MKAAKAAVRTAEINLARTEVKAPISGFITKSNFTVGNLLSVSQMQALATIHQTDPMYVELSQSSDDLYSLQKQLGKHGKVKDVIPLKDVRAKQKQISMDSSKMERIYAIAYKGLYQNLVDLKDKIAKEKSR